MNTAAFAREKQEAIDSFEAFFRGEAAPRWPLEVFLEASNVCNLRCAMCGPFSALNPNRHVALSEQQRGFFDVSRAQGSLDAILAHALYVHAFGYGEPTVHPDFPDLLRYISGYNVMVDFITNGMRLTSSLCEQIVADRVASVVVSFSGVSKPEYENVYIGGHYETVLEGVRRLADTRARAGSRYPRITINSIGFRHHIASLPEFVDLMAAHGVDVIEVKKLMDDVPAMVGHAAPLRPEVEGARVEEARARAARHGMILSTEQYEGETASGDAAPPLIPVGELRERARTVVQAPVTTAAATTRTDDEVSGSIDQQLGLQPLTVEHFGTENPFYCLEPFKTLYVRRNGLVKPCCFAPDSAMALGNAFDNDAAAIWEGLPYDAIRTAIADLRYPKPACESCIRRGSGPKRNVIRERIRDYVSWFNEGSGVQLSAPAVVEAVTREFMPALHAARATEAAMTRRVLDAFAVNPHLALAPASAPLASVVVPIHGAFVELCEALESVARDTREPFRLVLIDDGSRDRRISRLLRDIHDVAPHAVIIERRDNCGFVRTVNEGFAISPTGDVVILNSDTVVSPRWLEKLVAVGRSRPDVATVTPLTNNGTICSVPRPMEDNNLPVGYDVPSFAALIEATSFELFPEAPTGVGFCMLVTREALDRLGPFDAEAFGTGYGEENDFCQRAIGAGMVNLIADHTFVFHRGRGSFGSRSDDLIATNLRTVEARHPQYPRAVSAFLARNPLGPFHAYLERNISARRQGWATPLRVLHVLHNGGGTEVHARDLAVTDDRDVQSYVLCSDGTTLRVDEYFAGSWLRTMHFPLQAPIDRHGPHSASSYADAFRAVCWSLSIDLVHVHHLMFNTVDIASVADDLGIRYVMTLHDFHTVCPSYTLLDPDGRDCAACCDPLSTKRTHACVTHAGLKVSDLPAYQAAMTRFLAGSARLFVPNVSARDRLAAVYPEVTPAITVIEHASKRLQEGRSADDGAASRVSRSGPLNVAVIGGLDVHKGARVLRDLLRANERQDIRFHLYGTTPDAVLHAQPGELRRIGESDYIYHGPYKANAIVASLRADCIDVGLLLSVWPETFSFTLSEFAEARIPVIAGRLGAQGERVERCRLGWTVPDVRDARSLVDLLGRIADQPALCTTIVADMHIDEALLPFASMWKQYADIYRSLTQGRPPMNSTESEPRTLPRKSYVQFLGTCLAQQQPSQTERIAELQAEVSRLRELLRSPRHRVADVLARGLQRVPLVWPLVSRVTDAFLTRHRRQTS